MGRQRNTTYVCECVQGQVRGQAKRAEFVRERGGGKRDALRVGERQGRGEGAVEERGGQPLTDSRYFGGCGLHVHARAVLAVLAVEFVLVSQREDPRLNGQVREIQLLQCAQKRLLARAQHTIGQNLRRVARTCLSDNTYVSVCRVA